MAAVLRGREGAASGARGRLHAPPSGPEHRALQNHMPVF
jgi:hypothetical protein